jgi:Protein of unknown function (DUF4007)
MEAKSGAACGAVRKMRGTPGQRVGWNTHDPGMFCSCTPEMYEPLMCAFSPHVSRGYADQQNSQPVNGKKQLHPEESFDCPLLQLDLIQPLPDGELYRFAIGPKPSLSAAVFAFALAQYFDRIACATHTLNVQKCLYDEGSPGQAFKLDENSLIEYVEELESHTAGAIILDETAGLKQIYRRKSFDPMEILDHYYWGNRRQ